MRSYCGEPSESAHLCSIRWHRWRTRTHVLAMDIAAYYDAHDRSLALITTKRKKGRELTRNRTPYVDHVRFTRQDGRYSGENVQCLLLRQLPLIEEVLFHKLDIGHHVMVAGWAVLPDEELVVGRCPTDRLWNLYVQACNRKRWSIILRSSCSVDYAGS
jgi:hypothetical protein